MAMKSIWLSLSLGAAVISPASAYMPTLDTFRRAVHLQNTTEPPHYYLANKVLQPLVAKPGVPSHGQPQLQVTVDNQTRASMGSDYAYYVLNLDVDSFVGGMYHKDTTFLYVGCRAPNATGTDDDDDLVWNLSRNCRASRGGLKLTCEVPFANLANDHDETAACTGEDIGCGSDLYIAFRALAKDAESTTADFWLWAQGQCVAPAGKNTTRAQPLCDEAKQTMAQYFKFRIDCK